MARLTWDNTSERYFETGISNGILFVQNDDGTYQNGVPWNGLTKVSEKYSGGDAIHVYADDYYYTDIFEREDLSLTLEAYTYPDEFEQCNGLYWDNALLVSMQERKRFALCYRTVVGNDVDGVEHGYKLHIVYDCVAKPTECEYRTLNESAELVSFSWDIEANNINISGYRPLPMVVIDSRKTTKGVMAKIESYLYGTPSTESILVLPDAIRNTMNSHYLVTEYGEPIVFGNTRILV